MCTSRPLVANAYKHLRMLGISGPGITGTAFRSPKWDFSWKQWKYHFLVRIVKFHQKCETDAWMVRGCAWTLLNMHEYAWICMGMHGYAWTGHAFESRSNRRLCPTIQGQSPLAEWDANMHGFAWTCMVLHRCAWICMNMHAKGQKSSHLVRGILRTWAGLFTFHNNH